MIVELPRINVKEETRQSVVALLESLLDDARKGEIDTIMVVSHYVNGPPWRNSASQTEILSEAIGQLEILKHKWLSRLEWG
jgi:hypothetical protein